MKLIYMMLVFALISSYCWAQDSTKVTIDQAQAEVRDTFRQVADMRENAVNKDGVKIGEWPGNIEYFGQTLGLAFEDNLFKLAEIITDNKQVESAPVYRSAIIVELRSDNSYNRGLACQLAGLYFDLDFVYALGQLIDDNTPSVPVMTVGTPQTGPAIKTWVKPTVGQMAKLSLISLIQMSFTTKAHFDNWWKANKNYKDKLWYWSAKWNRRVDYSMWISINGNIHPTALPVKVDGKVLENDLQTLAGMPGDTGLKILLLHDNTPAKQYEAYTSVGLDDKTAREHLWVIHKIRDSMISKYDLVTKYVKDHKLKLRLLELMRNENLYPEVKSGGSDVLFWRIYTIGVKVFTLDDEPILAVTQQKTTDRNYIILLAMLRIKLSPEKADAIALNTLNKHPDFYQMAVELISRHGTANPKLLLKSFSAVRYYEKDYITEAVYNAAKKGLPVSASFVAEMAESLDDLEYKKNDSNYFSSSRIIRYLAQTVNIIKGKEIIPIEKILEPFIFKSKVVDSRIAEERAREFPKVFNTVRDTIITELQK
ncbi:MAG: hypothetical protein ACYC27_03460 [Armatimonadota bacterium]